MIFRPRRSLFYFLALGAVGCGGSGPTTSSIIPSQPPSKGVSGTATFTVDVTTGKVKIAALGEPSNKTSRAIFSGSAVTFSTTGLFTDSGELTRKVLNVSLTNNRIESINGSFRILFSNFQNVANPNLDQRANTTISTIAGTGAPGAVDGGASSAQIKQPLGSCFDPLDGSLFFGTTDGRVRRLKNGVVSTICSGLGTPAGMCFGRGPSGQIVYAALFVADSTKNMIFQVNPVAGTVTPFIGKGTASSVDGDTTTATFSAPTSIACVAPADYGIGIPSFIVTDSTTGKLRLVAYNNSIGTISATTVTTGLNKPTTVAVNADKGLMGVTETGANRIQLYSLLSINLGIVSPIATLGSGGVSSVDGAATTAGFNAPQGLCATSNAFFVADTGSNRIRQITLDPNGTPQSPGNWTVATLAGGGSAGSGDGTGLVGSFSGPTSLVVDSQSTLLVTDTTNNKIRRVSTGNIVLPIQVGTSTGAVSPDPVRVSNPTGYYPGNPAQPYYSIYSSIASGSTVQLDPWSMIVPAGVNYFQFTVTVEALATTEATPSATNNVGPSGAGSPSVMVRTYSGGLAPSFNNGNLATAGFGSITELAGDTNSGVWVADTGNNAIRRIGWSTNSSFGGTTGSTGGGTTGGTTGGSTNYSPEVVSTIGGTSGVAGLLDGLGSVATFKGPTGVAVSPDGTVVFVVDSGNNSIRRIATNTSVYQYDPSNPIYYTVTTIAGIPGSSGYFDGTGKVATFNKPFGIALSPQGDLFVTEAIGNRVRRIAWTGADPALSTSYIVSTIAGDTSTPSPAGAFADGTGSAAKFNDLRGIAYSPTGDLVVADRLNHKIRKIAVGGIVTTLAGSTLGFGDSDTGSLAKFAAPTGVSITPSGYVFVSDSGNAIIRRVSPGGTVRTVAGRTASGTADGTGDVAQFSINIAGSSALPSGDLLVSDGTRIRVVERIITSPN